MEERIKLIENEQMEMVKLIKILSDEVKKLKAKSECIHQWEEHGCALPIKKYFVCTKCSKESFSFN